MHVHGVPYDIVLLHLLNYSSVMASEEGIPPTPLLSSETVADDAQQPAKLLASPPNLPSLIVFFLALSFVPR
jgi:hypothetical protein